MENKFRKPKNIFHDGAISPSFISDSIAKHSTNFNIGGHSIFLGQVRADYVENQQVKCIEYSANQELALQLMFEIRESIFEKFDLTCMHVHHSLGKVATGEICLFVFTSSTHRLAAIEACSEIVERIKRELPIWGKEILNDENYIWKVNK